MDNKWLEDWERNNINGRIAARIKEIAKDKKEKVYANEYDRNGFVYQGKKKAPEALLQCIINKYCFITFL